MSTPAQFFGEADFEFQGELYRLTIDNMAFLEAEEAIGKSLMEWAPQLKEAIEAGRPPMVKHLAALIYGALKVNHHDMTQKFVVDLAMGQHGSTARKKLLDAVLEALQGLDVPDLPEGEPGNASAPAGNRQQRRAAEAGTGTKSSASGAKPANKRKPSGRKPRGARS